MAVSDFIHGSSVAFVALLAMLVAYQMLTRKINLSGLIHDRRDGKISPGRIQALAATIFGAASYLMSIGNHMSSLSETAALSLPPVSDELLLLVGGSHSLYLTGKLGTVLQDLFNFNRNT